MNIVGYHTILNEQGQCIVADSDGDIIQEPPYIPFLMRDKGESIKIFYHLNMAVACLCKAFNFSEPQCRHLFEKGQLYYQGWTFKYMPNKFFSIRWARFGNFVNFSDASQYEDWKLLPNPTIENVITKAKDAQRIGQEVYDALRQLDLHPVSLTSPIRSYEKEVLSKIDLPTVDDMPQGVAEYSYICCRGGWTEAFQKGDFEAWDYDLVSAYPSETTKLLDTRLGYWKFSKDYIPNARYGFCSGKIRVNSPFHPILLNPNDEEAYPELKLTRDLKQPMRDVPIFTPTGSYQTIRPKQVINFLDKYKLGSFEFQNGWFWIPKTTISAPLKNEMERLYKYKNTFRGRATEVIKRVMCFIPHTQVWTENGIKDIKSLKLGELVYSINPITFEVSLKPVEAIHHYFYNGDTYLFKHPKYKFLVTPEHNFFLSKTWKTHYNFVKPQEIIEYRHYWKFPPLSSIKGEHPEYISLWDYLNNKDSIAVLPNKKWSSTFEKRKAFRRLGSGRYYITEKINIDADPDIFEKVNDCQLFVRNNPLQSFSQPWKFPIDAFLSLIGWYISEGNLEINKDPRNPNNYDSHRVQFANNNPEPIEQIAHICGFRPSTAKFKGRKTSYVRIHCKLLYKYLINSCGKYSFNKKIPNSLFSLDHTHLRFLFNSLMDGDGTWGNLKYNTRKSNRYSTVSKILAEDFRRLCLHLGYKTRLFVESPSKKGRRNIYRILIYSPKCNVLLKRTNISSHKYTGLVYCPTIKDNGTLLAGMDGHFEFVGNSGIYGKFLFIREQEAEDPMGDNFNPVFASEIETNTQLKVARFIIENSLQANLLHIATDGVLSSKPVPVPENPQMGDWALSSHGPAMVISSGIAAVKGKEVTGEFSLSYNWLLDQIKQNPNASEYSLTKWSPVSLGVAMLRNKFEKLGQLEILTKTIHIPYELKRGYKEKPKTGAELLARHYISVPRDISQVAGMKGLNIKNVQS
jgi:hypothetical protein